MQRQETFASQKKVKALLKASQDLLTSLELSGDTDQKDVIKRLITILSSPELSNQKKFNLIRYQLNALQVDEGFLLLKEEDTSIETDPFITQIRKINLILESPEKMEVMKQEKLQITHPHFFQDVLELREHIDHDLVELNPEIKKINECLNTIFLNTQGKLQKNDFEFTKKVTLSFENFKRHYLRELKRIHSIQSPHKKEHEIQKLKVKMQEFIELFAKASQIVILQNHKNCGGIAYQISLLEKDLTDKTRSSDIQDCFASLIQAFSMLLSLLFQLFSRREPAVTQVKACLYTAVKTSNKVDAVSNPVESPHPDMM